MNPPPISPITIKHAPAHEIGQRCPGLATLGFADPPFNWGKDYGETSDDSLPGDEYVSLLGGWIAALADAVRPGGKVLTRQGRYYQESANHLRRRVSRHGLTVPQYERMLAEQRGLCGVCGCEMQETTKGPCIDHCHETGSIRGLLCSRCNTGLGMFLDDPDYLTKAAAYLSREQQEKNMSTTADYMVRSTVKSDRFAQKDPQPRRGRPTLSWVLVSGVKRLEVYNADKGGVIIEGEDAIETERKAYAKAQSVGKRMGLKLRAIPFSSAFYQA